MKSIKVGGKTVKLQVWDTAGQERFRSLSTCFYKNADGLIIAYDVTCTESFNDVEKWIDSLAAQPNCDCRVKFLVGCKVDLIPQRKVTTKQGEEKGIVI